MKAKADAAAAATAAEAGKAKQEEEEALRQHTEAKEYAEQAHTERQRRRESSKLKSRRHREVARTAEEMRRAAATAETAEGKAEAARSHLFATRASLRKVYANESAKDLLTKASGEAKANRSDLLIRAKEVQEEAKDATQEVEEAKREAEEAMRRVSEAEAGADVLRKEFRQLSGKTVRKVSRRMSKVVPVLEDSHDGNAACTKVRGSFCPVLQGDCEESAKHAAGLSKLKSSRKFLEITEDNVEEPEVELLAKSNSIIIGENPMLRINANVAARPVASGRGRVTTGFAGIVANLRRLCQSSAWPAAGLGLAVGWCLLAPIQRRWTGVTASGTFGPGPWAVLVTVSRNAAVSSRRSRMCELGHR
mmetsp:Transcript_24260/g.65599  ORF Transcript_24260/g.65599 Transcript_24260/m.65599 type:complete len:364 (+) Transcript_24260:785-1876(+)